MSTIADHPAQPNQHSPRQEALTRSDENAPTAVPVPAAAHQVETALAALSERLSARGADPEDIGMRCAEVLAAARQLEHAAAADLRAAGRSWAAVGRALGMTKQSAHERFGKLVGSQPPSPRSPTPDRQELLTTPVPDRAPAVTGQQPAEVDAASRTRPTGSRRIAGRQDPPTDSTQQFGQDRPVPTRRRRGVSTPRTPATPRSRTTPDALSYDLIKAPDHATTGSWVVTVDGAPVGSVRRTVTTRGMRQWTAWLGDTKLALHHVPRTRQDAAVQVLMAHNAQRSRRR